MCLVLLANHVREDFPLLLLCNRDEFFDRPTDPLQWWKESPVILAGRDGRFGGTWLAVRRDGLFALLTNFRNGQAAANPTASGASSERSRGELVLSFLRGDGDGAHFARQLSETRGHYKPFNMIFGSAWGEIFFYSSEEDSGKTLSQGIFGLSNASLDTPWPKVTRAKALFREALGVPRISHDSLFGLMKNSDIAADESLPSTGVPVEWERALSPICIKAERMNYGTRSTGLVVFEKSRRITFIENSYSLSREDAILNRSFTWMS